MGNLGRLEQRTGAPAYCEEQPLRRDAQCSLGVRCQGNEPLKRTARRGCAEAVGPSRCGTVMLPASTAAGVDIWLRLRPWQSEGGHQYSEQ